MLKGIFFITVYCLFHSAMAQTPSILWQYNLHDMSFGQTSARDLEGDGKLELIFSTYWNNSNLYCLNAENGTLRWKQPVKGPVGGCNDAGPLIFDPFRNGNYKVILPGSCNDTTFCFDADSGYVQWKTLTYGSDSPPSDADLNNDGNIEVLDGTFNSSVICLDGKTGSINWEAPVTDIPYIGIQTEPAIIADSGKYYFIVATWNRNTPDSDRIVCFRASDHSVLWQYPVPNIIYEGAAIGDLYRDGRKEAIIGDYSGNLYNFNVTDGSVNWIKNYNSSSYIMSAVTLADVDNDGFLNIIYNDGTSVYALKPDGSLLWTYPGYDASLRGSVVADVNNDQYPDVTYATWSGQVISLSGLDGSLIRSYDLAAAYGDTFNIDHAPIVADFNGDGILDVFVIGGKSRNPGTTGNYGRAYCLSWGVGKGPAWTMFRHDERRNACLCDLSGLPLPSSVTNLHSPNVPAINVFPDPAQERIFIQCALQQPGNAMITITDITGRILLQNKVNNNEIEVSVMFDVSGFAAGLYFVDVKTETDQLAAKFIKN